MFIASLTVRGTFAKCAAHGLISSHIALQIGDKHRVTTPVNWKKGEDVIVHPGVTNDEAKTLFPEFTIHKVWPSTYLIRPGLNLISLAVPANNTTQNRLKWGIISGALFVNVVV